MYTHICIFICLLIYLSAKSRAQINTEYSQMYMCTSICDKQQKLPMYILLPRIFTDVSTCVYSVCIYTLHACMSVCVYIFNFNVMYSV